VVVLRCAEKSKENRGPVVVRDAGRGGGHSG